MSGGHWDYCGSQIRNYIEEICEDVKVLERWPHVYATLCEIAVWVESVEHDMDWDLSGDAVIKKDSVFDTESCDILEKGIRDARNLLGKWGI